jgi:cytochrome c553
MTRNHIFCKAALALPFAGALLVSYSTARPALTDPPPLGAQIVAQGTASGAIACARCHGFDGEADGSGAFPKVAGQSSQYLAKQLRAYASGTRQNALMQPIAKGLKDAEIDSVAQYYASLRPSTLPSRPVAAQLVARGEQLAKLGDLSLRVQACESCHGPNGQGEPPAVPYLAGQYAHYIIIQIQMFRQGTRKSQQMEDPSHSLREQDVAAVAAYFEQAYRPATK